MIDGAILLRDTASNGANLTDGPSLQVLSQKLVLQRPSRPNTKPATIAECLVADATGCIILTARNEQGEISSADCLTSSRPPSWQQGLSSNI